MNLDNILAQLRQERDRIDLVITALGGLLQSTNGATRPSARGRRGGRRHMSAAGRKRLSEMMKKRWAQGRGPRAGRKAKSPRHMSAAARARIAAAQRARRAKVKAQKKKAA